MFATSCFTLLLLLCENLFVLIGMQHIANYQLLCVFALQRIAGS